MTIAFSEEVKARIAEHYDPHCIVWAHAVASLWGHADDHDLDEPVQLSEAVPVRVRFKLPLIITTDRTLSLDTIRAGRHVAIRFCFRDGTFYEVEVNGLDEVLTSDKTVEVTKS